MLNKIRLIYLQHRMNQIVRKYHGRTDKQACRTRRDCRASLNKVKQKIERHSYGNTNQVTTQSKVSSKF